MKTLWHKVSYHKSNGWKNRYQWDQKGSNRRARTGEIHNITTFFLTEIPVKVKMKMNLFVVMVANKGQGAERAVLVWHVCVMYADTSWVKALQDNNHNHACRLPDCQDICHCWQSYALPCVCVCVYYCERGRREGGWIFGSGSVQRTWEQPCFLNIHVCYPQWQFRVLFFCIKHQKEFNHFWEKYT